jgi:hypothetical protein
MPSENAVAEPDWAPVVARLRAKADARRAAEPVPVLTDKDLAFSGNVALGLQINSLSPRALHTFMFGRPAVPRPRARAVRSGPARERGTQGARRSRAGPLADDDPDLAADRPPGRQEPFSALEEAPLRRLVYQAFDLRDGPYLVDACAAIVDWHELTLPDRLERRAREAT